MKKEDKELLLKDLCARLPYEVKVSKVVEDWTSDPHSIRSINLNNIIVEDGEFEDGTPDIDVWDYEDIKPYLLPLSSMTEDQLYNNPIGVFQMLIIKADRDWENITINRRAYYKLIDWLNKNHIDYRGLIEKGLAIDATGLGVY